MAAKEQPHQPYDPEQKRKPGLLEQDRADGNKHDKTLSQKTDSVKANWLEDFRACHPQIKGTEIVEAVRVLCPGFDKTLLSKCLSPDRYGIQLSTRAVKALEAQTQTKTRRNQDDSET